MTEDHGAPSEAEDARLVRLARDGDRDAFGRLVRRHLRPAYGVAMKRTGDPRDAEDVCQEAFIKALEKIEECRKPERFRAWLLAIVRNEALNLVSRARRIRTEPVEALDATASQADDPAAELERGALRDALRRALGELPEMQRKVIVLHDYEGWSHGEIAEELGITAGTSRYHLHMARRRMRDALRPPDDPGVDHDHDA